MSLRPKGSEWRTAFIEYLANKGYSEYTPSGLPSTATNYANRIDRIRTAADCEAGISWEKLSKVIHGLIPVYDRGGAFHRLRPVFHNRFTLYHSPLSVNIHG